jgi:hypothetical protein
MSRKQCCGDFDLSLDDMTGRELIISLVSFVLAGIGVVGTVMGTKRRSVSPLFLDRHWDGHVYGRNDLPNPAASNPSVDKDEVARTPALSRPRLAALDDRSVAKETNVGVVQVI